MTRDMTKDKNSGNCPVETCPNDKADGYRYCEEHKDFEKYDDYAPSKSRTRSVR